jgi:S-adenosyl-L-methionine hydrolase (adenosine-forming)
MAAPPTITFLSDYGLEGAFVGACHGVMARICPGARVIDVTHGIPRHDIRAGALALRDSLPYLPHGVHLAVVDPGVGGERRAIALRTADGQLLVGPDNGMLWPGAVRLRGVDEAVDIGNSPYRLEQLSATFHGRDLFAPVAASLAAGRSLAEVGDPLSVHELVRLELPRPKVADGGLVATVVGVDRFGNIVLGAKAQHVEQAGFRLGQIVKVVNKGRPYELRFSATFGDVPCGEALLYIDGQRMLALAVNQGSAADHFGLVVDSEVVLRARSV